MSMLYYFKYQPRENVTYYSQGSGSGVQLEAVVERIPTIALHNNVVQSVTLYLPRGTESGQLSAVDKAADEVLVRVHPYGVEKRCRVGRIMSVDDFVWKVQAYA